MNTQQKEKKIIPYDSPEAASMQTVTGWVSRSGRFWGNDEHMARYDGCTHIKCQGCDALVSTMSYTHCYTCRNIKKKERWNLLPRKDWNKEDALYSETHDVYFFDEDELFDYCAEHGDDVESLRLVICEPISLSQIDSSYWHDDLSEDQELPSELDDALEHLNKIIREQPPVSWMPGKYVPTDQPIKKMIEKRKHELRRI